MGFSFSWEHFLKLRDYIYRKTGIYLAEEKHYNKIAKLLEKRGASHNLKTFRQYFTYLRFEDKDGSLFQELINSVTVNETYFFRENYQFEALVYQVLKKVAKHTPIERAIRILSAPVSTGEEPYSIAIHILEEGNIVAQRDIEIVGIDIDSHCIEKAKRAVFNQRSLHAMPEKIVKKYFTQRGDIFELSRDIAEAIHLEVANVFDKEQMRKLGKFDIIFSRNMLIYFDEASKKEVAMTFYDMLRPNGFIFLGHAEYMSRIVSVFTPCKFSQALAYQKESS